MGKVLQTVSKTWGSFSQKKRRTVFYDLEPLSFWVLQLWTSLTGEIKERTWISIFKSIVQKWILKKYSCGLCKLFLPNLGFIWYLARILVLIMIQIVIEFIEHIYGSLWRKDSCWITTIDVLWKCANLITTTSFSGVSLLFGIVQFSLFQSIKFFCLLIKLVCKIVNIYVT